MRTFSFPVRVQINKLAEFLVDPLGGVAVSKACLRELELKRVLIEPSLIGLLPPVKISLVQSIHCTLTEFGVPFRDSHYQNAKTFPVGVFWFVISSIVTRVLDEVPVPFIDDRPFDGVIVYAEKPEWEHPVPVNIYRDDGSPDLRVRWFPYDTSLWDKDTAILHL